MSFQQSSDPPAEGVAVAHRKLADLDARVGGELLVELQHEFQVVAEVAGQGRVRRGRHRAAPQRVVVRDEAAHLHQIQQPPVVVDVVLLVGVHEDEVERPVIRLLQPEERTSNGEEGNGRIHE